MVQVELIFVKHKPNNDITNNINTEEYYAYRAGRLVPMMSPHASVSEYTVYDSVTVGSAGYQVSDQYIPTCKYVHDWVNRLFTQNLKISPSASSISAAAKSVWDQITEYGVIVTGSYSYQGAWIFIAMRYAPPNDTKYGMMLYMQYNSGGGVRAMYVDGGTARHYTLNQSLVS